MRRKTIIALSLLPLAAGATTFLALGPDRFWRLGGDPDLGPVAFETLRRRATPNDALACPPGFCMARGDLVPASYAMSARDLRAAFARAIAAEPHVAQVASDDATLSDRYVQRSPRLGFPDTIVVRFLDRPEGGSTLALYSRSKFGLGDGGVNRARITRWLARLSVVAAPHPGQ